MELRCVISLCSNVLLVALVLDAVTLIAGNQSELCHSDQNCTAPLRCLNYSCSCPQEYCVTDKGCEPRPCQVGDPCGDHTMCPPNAECRQNTCQCTENYVPINASVVRSKTTFVLCIKKVFPGEECKVSEQCPRLATCEEEVCTCVPGTRAKATFCVKTPKRSMKSLEVYKAAMIVAACLMVVVLLAFLACVIKKSFFDDGPTQLPTVFSVSETIPEVGLPPYEKPPPYEEVVRCPTHQGDPPSYSDVMGACGSSHNPAFVPDV